MGIGDDPVGRPSTKGFSGVGLKSLILYASFPGPLRSWRSENYGPFTDVVANILSDGFGIVTNDETCYKRILASLYPLREYNAELEN